MRKPYNSRPDHADCSVVWRMGDAPISNDPIATGEFVEHRPLPRPMRLMGTGSAAAIRANLRDVLFQADTRVRRGIYRLRHHIGLHRRRMDPYVSFARELLAGPRTVGAVCPSSPHLARAMAGELASIDDGLVLELGAGTGSITRALLQQGIAPARLIAVERSPGLAAHLRKRFPAIRVIEGDATQLGKLLGDDAGRVRAVVSGLPLRSLPRPVVLQIAQEIRQLLPRNGIFVQFTYDLRTPSIRRDEMLKKERSRVVWKNLPPARVDTFVRQADALRAPSRA